MPNYYQADKTRHISLKFVIWFICPLTIIICLGFAVSDRFSNANIKADLAGRLKVFTGRETTIAGDIHYSIASISSLMAKKITIANKANSSRQPFADIDEIKVELALAPFLKKQIIIREIEINGLRLNLNKDRLGNDNWRDLIHAEKREPPNAETIFAALLPNSWHVEKLAVKNGQLSWRDEQTGKSLDIKDIDWQISDFAPNKMVQSQLSMAVAGKSLAMPGKITASGFASFDDQFQQWRLTEQKVEFSGFNPNGNLASLAAALTLPEALIDFKQDTARIPSIGLVMDEANLAGKDLALDGLATKPVFKGWFEVVCPKAKEFIRQWGNRLPEFAQAESLNQFAVHFFLQGEDGGIKLDKIDGKLDKAIFAGSAFIQYGTTPWLNFDMRFDQINLDDYLPKVTKIDHPASGSGMAIRLPAPPDDSIFRFNIDGIFHSDYIKFNGITAHDLTITLISQNKKETPAI